MLKLLIRRILRISVDASELESGLRSCVHGRYVIFFRPIEGLVRIERILHSAMDLTAQFKSDL